MAKKSSAPAAEQAGEEQAPAAEQAGEDASFLVTVRKGSEVLEVHPSCLAAHERAGWKVHE